MDVERGRIGTDGVPWRVVWNGAIVNRDSIFLCPRGLGASHAGILLPGKKGT